MIFTIDNQRRLRVSKRTGTIGPIHDPYGYEMTTLTLPHNRIVEWYTNGLGQVSWYICDGAEYQMAGSAFEIEELKIKLGRLKVNLLAKRIFGITLDAAEEAWREKSRAAEDDPMGPLSRYI